MLSLFPEIDFWWVPRCPSIFPPSVFCFTTSPLYIPPLSFRSHFHSHISSLYFSPTHFLRFFSSLPPVVPLFSLPPLPSLCLYLSLPLSCFHMRSLFFTSLCPSLYISLPRTHTPNFALSRSLSIRYRSLLHQCLSSKLKYSNRDFTTTCPEHTFVNRILEYLLLEF